MATFRIEYFSPRGQHIEFKPDGAIELFGASTDEHGAVIIGEAQARVLKAMVIAEVAMGKEER